jgi:hypothetical protein
LMRHGKYRETAVPQRRVGWSLLTELVGPDNWVIIVAQKESSVVSGLVVAIRDIGEVICAMRDLQGAGLQGKLPQQGHW